MAMRSVTRSRVVPGVAVTMARSRSTRRLKSELLPALGAADDGKGEAIVNDAATGEGCLQRSEGRRELVDAAGDLLLWRHVDIVFREIDAGFEERDEFHEGLLQGLHAMAERAAHLAGGLTSLREGLRIDEVADGFGLDEIEFAGKEGPLGELAGLSETCTDCERAAQQQIEDNGRAVRGDLNEVFRGVGVGCGEEGDDGFIDGRWICVVGIENVGEPRACMLKRLAQGDELGGDLRGLRTTETHDADATPRPGGVEMAAMVSTAASMATLRP